MNVIDTIYEILIFKNKYKERETNMQDTTNKDYNNIYSEVIELLENYVDVTLCKIEPTLQLAQDLCLNSFDNVSLIADLEDKYNISIEIRDVLKLNTVMDMVDYVSALVKERENEK